MYLYTLCTIYIGSFHSIPSRPSDCRFVGSEYEKRLTRTMGAITLTTNFVYLFFLFWLASTIRWRVDYSKLALTWHHTQTISISALGSLFFSLFFFIRVSYTCDIPNFKWGEIFFFLSLCVLALYGLGHILIWTLGAQSATTFVHTGGLVPLLSEMAK